MNAARLFLLVGVPAGSMLAADVSSPQTPCQPTPSPVSFAKDVQPLLDAYCSECHAEGRAELNFVLDEGPSWKNLVGQPSIESPLVRIAPGDPKASYVWHKLRGTHLEVGGSGGMMPFQNPPVPDNRLAIIEEWIKACAPNN